MYMENPKKWMKNHGLSKKWIFLLCSVLYCMERRGHSCTIRLFFLKKRDLVFYFTILSTFYSLLKRLTWVLTQKAACSSYNLRNVVEYKDRCQVIIFLFWTLPQLGYYLVTGGERARQHQHCGMQVGDLAPAWWATLGQWKGH